MSSTVSLLVNVGISLIVAAAGLVLDSTTLVISGLILLVAALVWQLRQHELKSPSEAASGNSQAPVSRDTYSPEERELRSLRNAIGNARTAAKPFSGQDRVSAWHRLEAAYSPVAARYDLPSFTLEAGSMRSMLKGFADYAETFLPLLEDGHYAGAKRSAYNYIHSMTN